jgi:uncharacterized protein YndB with AHSA1/START domain
MHGTFETIDGRPALHFERRYPHPVGAVWRAVTEPDELAHWFPATVSVDLRVGGPISFVFEDDAAPPGEGEVLELDPSRRFAFSWGDEELRFELEPQDAGACLLRFTHVLSARDAAARDAAGWHVCLDRLERRLAGEHAEAPSGGPTAEWRAHYDEYVSRGLPVGAAVPGEDG